MPSIEAFDKILDRLKGEASFEERWRSRPAPPVEPRAKGPTRYAVPTKAQLEAAGFKSVEEWESTPTYARDDMGRFAKPKRARAQK